MEKGSPSLLKKALLAILLILLPISILFIHDYLGVKEKLRVNEIKQNRALAEGYEGMVYAFLEMSKRRAQDFSSDGEIRSSLQGILDGKRDFDKQLGKYLSAHKMPLDKTIYRIDVASLDGRVLASTEGSETGKSLGPSVQKGEDGASVSEFRAGGSETPSIVISVPIISKTTGMPIGIIANFLYLSELNRILVGEYSKEAGALSSDMSKDETLKVYIVNREGFITSGHYADGMSGQKIDTLPVIECRDSNREKAGFWRNHQGVEVVGASMCMPEMGWTLLVEADEEKALKQVNEMLSNALSLGVIIAGLILLLGFLFIRKVVMPLRLLANAVDSLAQGDYNLSLPVGSHDEIGELTESFNIMAGEVKKRSEIILEGQKRLATRNHLYLILSRINEAIVRIHDRDKLFKEACRIIVEDGHFKLAWIGIVDTSTLLVKPVAFCCGDYEGSYVDGIVVSADSAVHEGLGPTGTSIRERRHVICNDIENDPLMALWRDRAIRYGYRSSAAFPLRLGTDVAGAIMMYSGAPHFFNNEEVELLDTLTADISFAIEVMEVERQAKLAEEERLSVQQRFEGLVNNLPVGIVRYIPGDKGHFVEANPAFITMLEAASKEELFSHDVSDCYGDKNKSKEIIDKIQKNGFIENEEVDIVTLKGNRRRMSISTVLKKDNEGNIYLDCVAQDITEHKNLEAQLLHSQKMEAVGQLAGGIAHDFNNALTAILGFGKLLLLKRSEDELTKNYAQHIIGAGESAASLVQGILAYSRKQTIVPQPIDINELARNVEKILLRLIGEDIELKTVFPDASIVVKADPTQIEQILMNLATNARDAMPDGGTITISIEPVKLDDEFVRAHGYGKPGPYAMISFADTGMGIDEETQKRIFEPFFTTKEVGKGTGLGLFMVYGIIKQHEGFINVYSEPGRGTNFKIYLPLAGPAAGGKETEEGFIMPRGSETVLLAEDDERVRKITLSALEDLGYHVIVAVNGEDAISKFKENKDRIQLCITDMVMPKMGGREAFEEMRKIRPDLRVIFMSGYAPDRAKGIIDEGLDFVSKPVSPTDFLRKVREVLDR
ncbi:MAG: ATP-binding protein [Deltaproteobacteria bacterium]